MKRLRIQFGVFFILLAILLGYLLWHTYRQIDIEERDLWKSQAERIYNQMQATISDFLTAEDRRALSEYRFTNDFDERALPKQPTPQSPIANIPSGDVHGLVGYFQIDPDGTFATPYLPRNWPVSADALIPDAGPRRKLQKDLEGIAKSLRSSVTEEGSKSSGGFVELGRMDTFNALGGSQNAPNNVYPNPVQEQAARYEQKQALRASMKSKSAAGFALDRTAKKEGEAAEFAAAKPATPQAPASATPILSRDDLSAPPGTPLPNAAHRHLKYVEPDLPDNQPQTAMDVTGASSLLSTSQPADPFQARLVGERYLLFYRKVWKDKATYIQGFVVELRRFYDWLMEQTFANSELPDFALTRLQVADTPVAQYGLEDLSGSDKPPFFSRDLGYPLNRFSWDVYADRLPQISTRLFLNVLAGLLFGLLTVGLYMIYRTAASQIVLSQKRQDFVSAVTHELKTPLTSIRMYSEMLEDGWAKDPEKLREYYGHINKESGRLSRLIENVLQLARLEKKTYKLNLKKEHPSADFKELAEEIRKIAERQGFPLAWQVGPDVPPIIYDPEAIKQVLITLLDNSVKFAANAADKSLEIALFKEKDHVVLAFRDRGPGIPPGELKKVFKNFYRVENEMTRKTQGTGIGLAMSRMMAEAMGAHIEARNRARGGLEVRLIFRIFR